MNEKNIYIIESNSNRFQISELLNNFLKVWFVSLWKKLLHATSFAAIVLKKKLPIEFLR